jgi:hypothetical protein
MFGIEAKGMIYYLKFASILSVVNLLPIKVSAVIRMSKYRMGLDFFSLSGLLSFWILHIFQFTKYTTY